MTKRQHIKALWDLLVRYEPQIDYRQDRPFSSCHLSEAELRRLLKQGHRFAWDCSETITLVCRLAGLRSPSGPRWPYSSCAGNTETMYAYLPHYMRPSAASVGAIVHFVNEDHACQVIESGRDPLLGSHGSGRGPLKVRLSVERQYHPGPVVFLNVSKLI